MNLATLFLLAVGLSMDAFAVSICKGLATEKVKIKHMLLCGVWFGGFQALMPLIGYLLGSRFVGFITNVTPWIAFALLGLIGANMIREAFSKEEEDEEDSSDPFCFKTMLLMAIATSIDALAVGITFACVPVKIAADAPELINTIIGVVIIGITTFLFSIAGTGIGNVFGSKYKSKAEFAGGIILILLAVKIILEHFNIINF